MKTARYLTARLLIIILDQCPTTRLAARPPQRTERFMTYLSGLAVPLQSIHPSPQPRTLRSLLAVTLIEYALKRGQYPPPAHQALGAEPFKMPSRTPARVRTFRPRGEA